MEELYGVSVEAQRYRLSEGNVQTHQLLVLEIEGMHDQAIQVVIRTVIRMLIRMAIRSSSDGYSDCHSDG